MRLAWRNRLASGLILVFSHLAGAVPWAPADLYSFTTLDRPNGGGTVAVGINNTGQIVGEFGVDNGLPFGFALSGGSYTTIPSPARPDGSLDGVSGVNDNGQMVGAYYATLLGLSGAFLYSGGKSTDISPPNATFGAQADGINGTGQVVGWYSDGLRQSGFLLSGGVYTRLDDPNAVNGTFAYGINNAGQIVGSYRDSQFVSHGFLLSNGVFTTIDDPNAGTVDSTGTSLYGINNAGLMSGSYIDANGVDHGFVLRNGVFTTLDDPNAGVHGTVVYGINDAGQVVGTYADSSTHGFLATATNAVPEPSTLMTSLVGALALLGRAWYRRRAARVA